MTELGKERLTGWLQVILSLVTVGLMILFHAIATERALAAAVEREKNHFEQIEKQIEDLRQAILEHNRR